MSFGQIMVIALKTAGAQTHNMNVLYHISIISQERIQIKLKGYNKKPRNIFNYVRKVEHFLKKYQNKKCK
jgi:hypothetical protein